jgi:hypothetical protein
MQNPKSSRLASVPAEKQILSTSALDGSNGDGSNGIQNLASRVFCDPCHARCALADDGLGLGVSTLSGIAKCQGFPPSLVCVLSSWGNGIFN